MGGVRFDGEYFGGDGGVCGSRGAAVSMVLIPEGKIAWGKLSQSHGLWCADLQLKTDFDGCVRVLTELVQRFPMYLLNSVNPYRLEGQKTPAMEILEQMDWQVPDHIDCAGRQPGELLGAGQGLCGDEAAGPDSASAEDQRDPGGGGESAVSLVQRRQPRVWSR